MRNPTYKYKPNLIRNKSMNNLINYDYNRREDNPRKIYYINYNEKNNTINSNHQLYIDKNLKEDDNDNDNDNDNIIYDNNYYYNNRNNGVEIESNNNNIDNHKYHNIVHKNKDNGDAKEDIKKKKIERNKIEIEPINSPQISRREVARYYHIVNPRKYSYEKEMQYKDNNDNHRYKEIRHINGQEDKIILKSRPKFKKYNNNKINNNNTEFTSNIYYRYATNEDSQKYLNPNIIDSPKEQLKSPQIVKETFNTRLVNSKSFKKSPSEKVIFNPKSQIKYIYNLNNSKNNFHYNEEPNLNSNSKNITFNSYNEYDANDALQIPSKYQNNSKLKLKQFYDEKYDSNSHINMKPESNYNYYKVSTIRNTTTNHNNNNIYNINNINNNKISKTLSLTNLYKNKLFNPRKVQNEYNYSSNNNNNIQRMVPPNIDYATLKQTVKLAVLKKQMKEQEKKKNLNYGSDYNNMKYLKNKKNMKNLLSNKYNGISKNTNDNLTILEKTKKLLEKDKYKNDNIYNHKNDYNQNILKLKGKIWKP